MSTAAVPAWIVSQRRAREQCERCGQPARTEDPFGRLWCRPCWDEKTAAPDALEVTGPNVWAVRTEPGEDGLTTFTHLSGPGIPGVIGARQP